MPDAVAEIIAAVGEAVTKDSEFMDEGEETTNPVVRVMSVSYTHLTLPTMIGV